MLVKDYYRSTSGWSDAQTDEYMERGNKAGMTVSGIQKYKEWALSSGFYELSDGSGIYSIRGTFTSNITGYESGDFHAIIVKMNPNGTYYYYDAVAMEKVEVEDPKLLFRAMY